jgi:hypothetical protein
VLVTVSGQSAACSSLKPAGIGFDVTDVKKKLKRWDICRVPILHSVISETVVDLKYRREIAVVRNLTLVYYRGRIQLSSPKAKGKVVTLPKPVL